MNEAVFDSAIKLIESLPSPEGCGCKARKEKLLQWLTSARVKLTTSEEQNNG